MAMREEYNRNVSDGKLVKCKKLLHAVGAAWQHY